MTAPRALITGASSGIGRELARLFAADGYEVIINAEDDEIHEAARQLVAEGASVRAVQADLRTEQGVEDVWTACLEGGRPLDAAALNAGVGQGGPFIGTDLAAELDIIDLNVRSTVHLAKLVLTHMADRNAGKVLFTSSIASTMPGSYQAIYNASKSFIQSFAEALQDELRDRDITITSLMPGPTATEFFERADMADNTRMGKGPQDDPADVARQGYEGLNKGEKRVVAASLLTKASEAMNKVMPDRIKAVTNRLGAEPLDD
jgi:short-subunit dehydrogenase